jgi:hypothetical protein
MVPSPEAILVTQEWNTERVTRTNRLRFATKHFSVVKSKAN